MSGTRPTPAEQHLGDRLSALVDGELGHESRDRVLAHLATCAKCKAEADAQRRLKSVFAEMAPPPPSESFLARLQGLPGGGDSDSPRLNGGSFGGGLPGGSTGSGLPGVFGTRGGTFGYVPAGPHADVLPPAPGRGFRIHDVSRHEADRSASRGLRFAFVAAGAVSLAAVALGGVTTGMPGDTDARGGAGAGSNVMPSRSQGTGATSTPESQRRRSTGPLLAQGERSLGNGPVAPTSVSAPLLPGVPAPAGRGQDAVHTLTTPVVADAAAMSPLIRPLTDVQPLTPTPAPGLLAAPAATPSPTSAPSSTPRNAH
ncbi:anti-sigma factor family protein [Streptomyces sp. NPDC005070]